MIGLLPSPRPTRTRPDALALPAQRLVRSPAWGRRLTILLITFGLLLIPVLIFVPWQQTATGDGRVIAFTPLERQQTVEAPIKGRVTTWFVQEGDHVLAGDPIAEISDNDPMLLQRLEQGRNALLLQMQSADNKVLAYLQQAQANASARIRELARIDAKLNVLRNKIRSAEESLSAAKLAHKTAEQQFDRISALAKDGLESARKAELAALKLESERAKLQKARADLRGAKSELDGEKAYRSKVESDYDGKDADIQAKLEEARANANGYQQKLLETDTKIARQQTQRVVAPRSGTILRLDAREGTEQVKPGDALAVLVPDASRQAVELWVDGNDVPLVQPGHKVRLQFEGWPALQFSGWPSVAVGTFGGQVSFVDAADDGAGRFRVVIVPDPGEDPWPTTHLRQGVRVRGWILLAEVRLGFELWRQINGFPASTTPPPSSDGDEAKKKQKK